MEICTVSVGQADLSRWPDRDGLYNPGDITVCFPNEDRGSVIVKVVELPQLLADLTGVQKILTTRRSQPTQPNSRGK